MQAVRAWTILTTGPQDTEVGQGTGESRAAFRYNEKVDAISTSGVRSLERDPSPSRLMLAAITDLERRIAYYHGELVGFLGRRVTGDPEEAAQEVWLRVANSQAEFANDAAFRGYFYTVARRLVIDLHRRRKARIQLVEMDETTARHARSAGQLPDQNIQATEIQKVVEATLATLKPEIVQVFRWRLHDDLSFKDIAARQECSINTALGRMHRATKKLAAALEAAGLTGGAA